jgi:hypothetical protein
MLKHNINPSLLVAGSSFDSLLPKIYVPTSCISTVGSIRMPHTGSPAQKIPAIRSREDKGRGEADACSVTWVHDGALAVDGRTCSTAIGPGRRGESR